METASATAISRYDSRGAGSPARSNTSTGGQGAAHTPERQDRSSRTLNSPAGVVSSHANRRVSASVQTAQGAPATLQSNTPSTSTRSTPPGTATSTASTPTARTRQSAPPTLLQRFTRLFRSRSKTSTSDARGKTQPAQGQASGQRQGPIEKAAHSVEKLVDGLTVNAAGESVIVDNEAYLEAVRRNLPESLQRAYEQAVDIPTAI